jgi:hypothetical protein
MRQTTLSVALEVKPDSLEHLSGLLDRLRDKRSQDPAAGTGPFAEFLETAPTLHFMSISVFPGFDYDPLFVIEANFDGEPGPFWADLEAGIGPELRSFLRCCKKPGDSDGPLYVAVTEAGSRAPIAPYLQARSLKPTVYHHGNRGMTRDRILAEFEVFKATRVALAANALAYEQLTPARIHQRLRAGLVGQFQWLNTPAPPRIPFWENVSDWFNLAAFVVAVVFALSVPGLILYLAMPLVRYLVLMGAALVVFGAWLKAIGGAMPGTATPTRFTVLGFLSGQVLPMIILGVLVALYVALASAICTPFSVILTGRSIASAWEGALEWVALGLLSAPATITGVLVWLRTLERADSAADAPPVDPRMLREMAQREDWIPQNHMGSIVLIKPGLLRMMLITTGHRGLGLLLRIIARNGYLGSMRTIHFAHWAMVNNKSRLMFHSNFDQTWESYLDDFIEKAHAGLTLAWSCGIGFPPSRFLIFDGASHGSQFKEWARHSMSVSRFWYSAYKDLTTEQIERNFRIALGLRKTKLSEKEAGQWIHDL